MEQLQIQYDQFGVPYHPHHHHQHHQSHPHHQPYPMLATHHSMGSEGGGAVLTRENSFAYNSECNGGGSGTEPSSAESTTPHSPPDLSVYAPSGWTSVDQTQLTAQLDPGMASPPPLTAAAAAAHVPVPAAAPRPPPPPSRSSFPHRHGLPVHHAQQKPPHWYSRSNGPLDAPSPATPKESSLWKDASALRPPSTKRHSSSSSAPRPAAPIQIMTAKTVEEEQQPRHIPGLDFAVTDAAKRPQKKKRKRKSAAAAVKESSAEAEAAAPVTILSRKQSLQETTDSSASGCGTPTVLAAPFNEEAEERPENESNNEAVNISTSKSEAVEPDNAAVDGALGDADAQGTGDGGEDRGGDAAAAAVVDNNVPLAVAEKEEEEEEGTDIGAGAENSHKAQEKEEEEKPSAAAESEYARRMASDLCFQSRKARWSSKKSSKKEAAAPPPPPAAESPLISTEAAEAPAAAASDEVSEKKLYSAVCKSPEPNAPVEAATLQPPQEQQ